jgi:hypothetical protein
MATKHYTQEETEIIDKYLVNAKLKTENITGSLVTSNSIVNIKEICDYELSFVKHTQEDTIKFYSSITGNSGKISELETMTGLKK